MTLVVIDASAGVEIVCDTRRGRALARLLPVGAESWVPEHFYSEVLGVLRWQLLGQRLSESQASVASVASAVGIFVTRLSRRWSRPPGATDTISRPPTRSMSRWPSSSARAC